MKGPLQSMDGRYMHVNEAKHSWGRTRSLTYMARAWISQKEDSFSDSRDIWDWSAILGVLSI